MEVAEGRRVGVNAGFVSAQAVVVRCKWMSRESLEVACSAGRFEGDDVL